LPERDTIRRARQRMLGTMDLRENAVDSRVLRGHGSDDTQRAVGAKHQKSGSTTTRVLADLAVTESKLETNAATSRVIQTHATDDSQRGVIRNALRNEILHEGRLFALIDRPSYATGTGQIRALHADVQIRRDNLLGRLINNDPLETNAVDGRVLASGSTNAERAVDTAHTKDKAVTDRPSPRVATTPAAPLTPRT
jgi:hypothetical protein